MKNVRATIDDAHQALAKAEALLNQPTGPAGTEPPGRISARLAGASGERDQLVGQDQAQARDRILEAAQVEPESLSDQAKRTLDWLADWDTPTVEGVIELVAAARLAVYVECHRADLADKDQAVRDSAARLDAAFDRYDARFGPDAGTGRGGVEL